MFFTIGKFENIEPRSFSISVSSENELSSVANLIIASQPDLAPFKNNLGIYLDTSEYIPAKTMALSYFLKRHGVAGSFASNYYNR